MNRARMVTIGLVALVLSAVTTLFVYRILTNRLAPPQEDKVEVVVAVQDLALGTRIEEGQVRLVAWPKANLIEGCMTDLEAVVGRGVLMPIFRDEPVMESRLAAEGAGAGLTATIPEGMRAVSVKVDSVVGVAGFAVPGTRVDVILIGSEDERTTTDTSKVILENVIVLAADQNIERDANGRPLNVGVVTLLVTPEDAQKLSLAALDGRIQLALRNPLDLDYTNPKATKRKALYVQPSSDSPPPPPVRRVVRAPAPAPKKVVEPPPAPRLMQVELIQGSKRSSQTFDEKGTKVASSEERN